MEGLFGYRPDYAAGVVEVAPQFPSPWRDAAFASSAASLQFHTDLASTLTLGVQLAQPAPALLVRLPLRAGALGAVAHSQGVKRGKRVCF